MQPHTITPFSSAALRARQIFVALLQLGAGTLALLLWTGCGSNASTPPAGSANAAPVRPPAHLAALAAEAKPLSSLGTAVVKSVFQNAPESGRDPFFPNSKRRAVKVTEAAATPRLPLHSYLKLVGIRPGTDRPMALIN